ncbi:MAG: hypothetical protein ACKV2Q_07950 [Planctomycetaceae bacterium]
MNSGLILGVVIELVRKSATSKLTLRDGSKPVFAEIGLADMVLPARLPADGAKCLSEGTKGTDHAD